MMLDYCSKVILAAQARHAAKKAREMVQRKTVMGGGGLPGKLSFRARSCKMRSVSCRGRFGRGTANRGVTESFKQFFRYVVRF
jgi:DNA gyrase subunit B